MAKSFLVQFIYTQRQNDFEVFVIGMFKTKFICFNYNSNSIIECNNHTVIIIATEQKDFFYRNSIKFATILVVAWNELKSIEHEWSHSIELHCTRFQIKIWLFLLIFSCFAYIIRNYFYDFYLIWTKFWAFRLKTRNDSHGVTSDEQNGKEMPHIVELFVVNFLSPWCEQRQFFAKFSANIWICKVKRYNN